jgi:hypothetical protein
MQNVIYVLLRRLRAPLMVLICAYAVAVLGFAIIPGVDGQGRPYQVDFLHAFYIVSYTATTIGFGEIPYPFTAAQRLWSILTLYATVISWVYALGSSRRTASAAVSGASPIRSISSAVLATPARSWRGRSPTTGSRRWWWTSIQRVRAPRNSVNFAARSRPCAGMPRRRTS